MIPTEREIEQWFKQNYPRLPATWKEFVDVIQTYAKEVQVPQTEGKVYRWVKASERMPNSEGRFCVKRLGEMIIVDATLFKDNKMVFTTPNNMVWKGYKEFEWLEEAEPSLTKELPIASTPSNQEEVAQIQDLYHRLPECNLKHFLSLWFSVPVYDQELMEKIKGVLHCTCSVAYTSRDMPDPDCPQCNYADEVYALMLPLLNKEQNPTTERRNKDAQGTAPDHKTPPPVAQEETK